MADRYLEDFGVGLTFRSAPARIDSDQIKRFAGEFDPQPFHLDEEAARGTIFRGLAASGWHTAAVTMKLLVESDFKPAGGIVGAGFDELRWPRPVRPGDELNVESEVLEVRPSKSHPALGLIKVRMTTLNQNREVVLVSVGNLLVPQPSKIDRSFRIVASTMTGRDVPTVITRRVIGAMPSAPTLDPSSGPALHRKSLHLMS